MVKLSKRQARVLVLIVMGSDKRDAASREASANETLARAAEERSPVLAPNGCKVYARKRGAVTTYALSGYAHDGSDVADCMRIVRDLV